MQKPCEGFSRILSDISEQPSQGYSEVFYTVN